MGTPFLHEIKRQASFFIREKIKTARLALTDVTPIQLLTNDATHGDSPVPDARTMRLISRAAFEVDDYWRIVEILHNRLSKFDKQNWRASYNALIILEYLLTHGPLRVGEEFQTDQHVIRQMGSFQHIDERGFDWGLSLRKKAERILKLLKDFSFLQEERTRARKITCVIKGFGSFSVRGNNNSEEWILKDAAPERYIRSNSLFSDGCYDIGESETSGLIEKDELCSNLLAKASSADCEDNDHPFFDKENQTRASLLSSTFA